MEFVIRIRSFTAVHSFQLLDNEGVEDFVGFLHGFTTEPTPFVPPQRQRDLPSRSCETAENTEFSFLIFPVDSVRSQFRPSVVGNF